MARDAGRSARLDRPLGHARGRAVGTPGCVATAQFPIYLLAHLLKPVLARFKE
jgi:hypothetical protein